MKEKKKKYKVYIEWETEVEAKDYNDNKEVQDEISQNAADLKEKIEIALDDETTIEEIRDGDI